LEREECKEDWRAPIREALLKEEDVAKLKTVKDYVLIKGELYMQENVESTSKGRSYTDVYYRWATIGPL